MRKIIALPVAVLVGCSSVFAMPERTPHNVEKYKKICRENIHKVKKGMYREPKGSLKHKFITPGCDAYLDNLWDWDSLAVGNRALSDYARDWKQGRLKRMYGISEGVHIQCVGLLWAGGVYTYHNRTGFPFTRRDDQPD